MPKSMDAMRRMCSMLRMVRVVVRAVEGLVMAAMLMFV
jgi:hypothetical protein